MTNYQLPFTISNLTLKRVADISEAIGRQSVQFEQGKNLKLRRINQIRPIQGSLAIERGDSIDRSDYRNTRW